MLSISPWWLVAGLLLLVLLVVLEGRRQSRKMGLDPRKPRRTGSDMLGAGMLQMQEMLQPDRNVETVRKDMQDADRVHPEYRLREESDADPDEDENPES